MLFDRLRVLYLFSFVMTFSRFLIAPSLLVVLVFSGCGASGVSVTSDGGITVQGNANQGAVRLGEQVTIPADFPQDVPQYPGAKTQIVSTDAKEHSNMLSQQTSDSVATVKAFVLQKMADAGFSKTTEIGDDSVTIIGFEKLPVRFQFQIARDASKNVTQILTVRAEVQP